MMLTPPICQSPVNHVIGHVIGHVISHVIEQCALWHLSATQWSCLIAQLCKNITEVISNGREERNRALKQLFFEY